MADNCRVCLCNNRRMYPITNTEFQEIWERLTRAKFNTNDGKPLFMCYICCSQLRKSHQLMKRAMKAEELLTAAIKNGSEKSQKRLLSIVNLPHEFDYKYVTKALYQWDSNESNTVVEIKIEKEEGSGEYNEEESDISSNQRIIVDIKEEEEVAPAKKRKLNELPQKPKRIRRNKTTKDSKPSTNSVSKSLPNICAKSYKSFPNLALDTTMEISASEQNVNSIVSHVQVNEISPKVNIQSKVKIQAKNVIAENDTKLTTEVSNDNVEILKQCHICDLKCVTASALKVHLRRHAGEKPYACDLCDYKCSERGNLTSHIKYKHTKEKDFSCHVCQQQFVTKAKLNRHFRRHTGEKPYICDLCDFRSSDRRNLTNHISNKHTDEKNFSCHICQYKCVTKSGLIVHIRKHTGEKPYVCDVCDFRCSQKGDLKRHAMYKHTNERNFTCPVCHYKFVTNYKLNRHLRKHTGEKTFMCDLCDYKCSRKDHLENHTQYKHIKEKNFSCHMCQYQCVMKSELNRHLLKHTGENLCIDG